MRQFLPYKGENFNKRLEKMGASGLVPMSKTSDRNIHYGSDTLVEKERLS